MARKIKIKRLHRIRIGPVKLGALRPGAHRELTEREVAWFLERRRGGRSN
jgi:23S rRNA pseudouridine2605 synthase